MAIGKTGGVNNFQLLVDQANLAKTRTVSADQGRVAAQNSGVASEKSKDTDAKNLGERVTLSESSQAQLVKEQKALADDIEQAKAGMADEANQTHGDTKAKEKDRKIGEGRIEQKAPSRVFQLDSDTDENYEVTEAQGKRLESIDSRTPDQILEGMPNHARSAAAATLNTQMENKGVKKVAQLKDDPKVSAEVENMDLDLADSNWKKSALAPIKSAKSEPPLQIEDPHAEGMAKDAAVKAMQAGGEQMIV
jgi:hypothetical protein